MQVKQEQQETKPKKSPFQYLEVIDAHLLRRDFMAASTEFWNLLQALHSDWGQVAIGSPRHLGYPVYCSAEVCERASGQWQAILSSNLDFTQLKLSRVMLHMPELHMILMGSYQGNLDSYITVLHQQCRGQYQVQELLRLILAWCPTSKLGLNIFQYFNHAQELVFAHAVATIAGMALVSGEAGKALDSAIELLATPGRVDRARFGSFNCGNITVQAWMRCSYANHPKKHQVKRLLGEIIAYRTKEDLKAGEGLENAVTLVGNIANKPVLVVPLESFYSSHAMFRCYADVITPLREHFYLIGLAWEDQYDQVSAALFDEFYGVKELDEAEEGFLNVGSIAGTIKSWKPAAIFFPSVGMVQWVIELSQMRLAPVQAMTGGHPATSMSPEMDYFLLEDTYVGSEDCFSERVIRLPAPSLRHRLPSTAVDIAPLRALPSDGIIRIAIPSVAQKLTREFVDALRYVEEHAINPVRFVFMLGVNATQQVACEQMLRRRLKNGEYWAALSYPRYIEELNRCQIHAGTFPFGGTNSLIDSLRQGLPILALDGVEPHSLIDGDFARRAGLPEKFVCKTAKEYAERLLELVNNPEELVHWRNRLIDEVDIDQLFLKEGHPEVFAEALWSVLDKRDEQDKGVSGE